MTTQTDNTAPGPALRGDAPEGRYRSPTPSVVWSADADELLARKWTKGVSARAIAELLCDSGHQATKNSVLGRARRLGLGLHKNAQPARAIPKVHLLPLQRPGEKPKPEGCRFIEGDPAGIHTLWCDKPTTGIGEPYCAAHRSLCYRKPESWERVIAASRPQRAGTAVLLRVVA